MVKKVICVGFWLKKLDEAICIERSLSVQIHKNIYFIFLTREK